MSPSSGLAAVYLGSSLGWRVFYQDDNNAVTQLAGTSDTSGLVAWDSGLIIASAALNGSSLAVALVPPVNMAVFYVDATSQALYTLQYSYSTNWQTRKSPLTTLIYSLSS